MRPHFSLLATLGAGLLVAACQTGSPSGPSPAADDRPVTFNNQVVRIFQQHCQGCHRPGETAPFSLTTYPEAHRRHDDILTMVQTRKMPPWKAVVGHGEFADVRRLSDTEIRVIARWVADGVPEGDPRDLPPPRRFPTGWTLGTPGAVIAMEEPFTVPPRTRDVYRCFTVPIRLPGERRFISASEVLPGNRKVVHHVQTFLDVTGRSVELDRAEAGPGYTCFGGPGFQTSGGLGGWVPGSIPLRIPPRVAWGIPAGARLVVQVHYNNPGDTPQTDLTRVGLHFTSGPFDRRLHMVRTKAWDFVIPAGAARTSVRAWATVPEDLEALTVHAHMHLLGREVTVTAHRPDGTTRPLLRIDDWDFEWQLLYYFKRPVPLPSGTRIEVECVYDNSAANLRNPSSPPRQVTSGFETTDEMCLASVLGTVEITRR
jgi:mono/diheme cytochrome c family protein